MIEFPSAAADPDRRPQPHLSALDNPDEDDSAPTAAPVSGQCSGNAPDRAPDMAEALAVRS